MPFFPSAIEMKIHFTACSQENILLNVDSPFGKINVEINVEINLTLYGEINWVARDLLDMWYLVGNTAIHRMAHVDFAFYEKI